MIDAIKHLFGIHRFVHVEVLQFEQVSQGSQYAKCRHLYRCSICGKEFIKSTVEYY